MKEYRIVCDLDSFDTVREQHETGSKYIPGFPKACGTIYTSRIRAERVCDHIKRSLPEWMKRNAEYFKYHPETAVKYEVYNVRVQERDVSAWR